MEKRTCQNCTQEFTVDSEDRAFYQKLNVPPPTFCWLCRAQRRFCFRNERNLYKRKSDFSGKEIFSMYAPDNGSKVYEKDVWLSDQWDAMEYGQDVDFSKPFFTQMYDLFRAVPLKNLNVVQGISSDYANHFTEPKNCYLVFNGNNSEDCMYGNGLTYCRDCMDTSHAGKSENCYESFWLTQCANTYFSSQCENCMDVRFSKNCVGCNNCFGCVGLRNKSHHIFNTAYSKEEYEKILKEQYDTTSYEGLQNIKKEVRDFWQRFPNKFMEGSHNTAVSGNYLDHCKNVKNSFLVREGENLRYCQYVQELPGSHDCYDYSVWGDTNELVYESMACGIGTHRIKFCLFVQENVHDIEYSILCSGSSNLFGCVGLKKKEYCILNKQYTKEEYEKLTTRVREHMSAMPYTDEKGRVYAYGEYFPPDFSPWAYNETLAFDYFPLTREEATARGYRWRDPESRKYEITMAPEKIPDRVSDIRDSILNEVIACAHGGTCSHQCPAAFKIIPDELAFYRKNALPIPHLCPICRHYERLAERTKLHLYSQQCRCGGKKSSNGVYANTQNHFHNVATCPNTFETAYRPDESGSIYCEECYQQEFVA